MTDATLIVDASWCQTGAGGWGAWAKTQVWKQGEMFGGVVRGAGNSSECELRAIALALRHLQNGWKFDTVIVQSDSLRALSLMYGARVAQRAWKIKGGVNVLEITTPSPHERESLSAIRGIPGEFRVRHVKGHVSGGEGRHWVNSQCDSMARKWMNEERRRTAA